VPNLRSNCTSSSALILYTVARSVGSGSTSRSLAASTRRCSACTSTAERGRQGSVVTGCSDLFPVRGSKSPRQTHFGPTILRRRLLGTVRTCGGFAWMPTLSRQSCWVQHRVQTTRWLGEGPGPRKPMRRGERLETDGTRGRPARTSSTLTDTPLTRAAIRVTFADVTSAFRTHRKTMTPWIVPTPPRTPPTGVAQLRHSHIGVMHYLSTIVHNGGAFLHMRYTPWVHWRRRSGTEPAARFWQPRHPESLCFQGASP
jgi:hypothetical protein